MPDVTQILSRIEAGALGATEEILPLVYESLRRLAARRLAEDKPGQTLPATALVHEVYVRLVGKNRLRSSTLRTTNVIIVASDRAARGACSGDKSLTTPRRCLSNCTPLFQELVR